MYIVFVDLWLLFELHLFGEKNSEFHHPILSFAHLKKALDISPLPPCEFVLKIAKPNQRHQTNPGSSPQVQILPFPSTRTDGTPFHALPEHRQGEPQA